MAAPVTVYSTPTCPWCDRAKEYLRANNVEYVEKDVASDRVAAMEMVRRSGQQGVPVITNRRRRNPRLRSAEAGPLGPEAFWPQASAVGAAGC